MKRIYLTSTYEFKFNEMHICQFVIPKMELIKAELSFTVTSDQSSVGWFLEVEMAHSIVTPTLWISDHLLYC